MFFMSLAVTIPVHAQVYKCQEGGKTVFADRPCSPDSKVIDVRPARGEFDPKAAAELERQRVQRIRIQAATQATRDKAEERRERARAAPPARDYCDELRERHADAKRWEKEFRHPDNIKREKQKAKDASERSFFECPPSKRVSVFDE
ncbi:DUF4124 domain-containing protein [Parazoarcus communis]|uniref:DUF4124 domain-containing protein n=1 Tax=Parazoarcus communis TaxID=41977 RepID=UPI00131F4367